MERCAVRDCQGCVLGGRFLTLHHKMLVQNVPVSFVALSFVAFVLQFSQSQTFPLSDAGSILHRGADQKNDCCKTDPFGSEPSQACEQFPERPYNFANRLIEIRKRKSRQRHFLSSARNPVHLCSGVAS